MFIQSKELKVPLIQGGMGVGVSLSSLAGHVALCDAMGVISAAHPGYSEPNFRQDPLKTNCDALKKHIHLAKKIAHGHGLIGVNVMVASSHYKQLVESAIEGGCDAIISGAGLPLELPLYRKSNVLLAPIVSSGKAIQLICKVWDKRYQDTPDFIVIEGSKAGGHLGFKKEDLVNGTCQSLSEILKDVLKEIEPYQEKYNKTIPVFVGGGIENGKMMAQYIKEGASGIQIATPFIPTFECDASQAFKDAILQSNEEDIEFVKSPAGFPGRAIVNEFVKKTREKGPICMKNCLHCMIPCTPEKTPYCISEALIQSVQGHTQNGLIFVSTQAARLKKMKHVDEVINEYINEMEKER